MEELYVNKNGFKCVKSQLAKTEGFDPQEYERAMQRLKQEGGSKNEELAKLKVKVPEYAQ